MTAGPPEPGPETSAGGPSEPRAPWHLVVIFAALGPLASGAYYAHKQRPRGAAPVEVATDAGVAMPASPSRFQASPGQEEAADTAVDALVNPRLDHSSSAD
jgi:hypothetical protein